MVARPELGREAGGMGLGPREIVVIVLIIVLLFGARRIPELMRSLGSGMREFKKGVQGDDEDTTKERERIDESKKSS